MREIGEQWVEEGSDGKMHMYKAVAPIDGCRGCYFLATMMYSFCCEAQDQRDCLCGKTFIIRDLGPVNNIGLPLCPFCKGYPELESEENWEGKDIWFVECDKCGARTAEYFEESEAVDAWKRRAK
jgi:Zn ribbon nucleic-acid-binding protein